MNKVLSKILSVILVMLICFLILNEYYVIKFSDDLRNVFAFLAIVTIFLTSIAEIISKGFTFSKFLSFVILFSLIVGGTFAIINRQMNLLIYICILSSLIQGLVQLISSKA